MAGFLLRRLAVLPLTVLLVATISFVAVRVLPGNPAQVALGDQGTAEAVRGLEREMGLDRPLPVQYGRYLASLARGDLGRSITTHRPVTVEILRQMPFTFLLALSGAVLGVIVGLPAGVLSATLRSSGLDYLMRLLTLAGLGMPIFYLGLLSIWLFGLRLGWLPAMGSGDLTDPTGLARHLILPGLVVGLNIAPLVMRVTRSSVLDVLHQDYVRTARAKGFGELRVIGRHVMMNALIPVITIISLQAGNLLGGSIITESVFARRGVGQLMIASVLSRDYPQVEGGLIFFALLFTAVNILADVLYAWVNPTVRSRAWQSG
jgi:ABC-type dipeptide/oligopeptide/nickel transport system permease component